MRILLVEDNPADARLLRENLAEAGPDQFAVHQAGCLGDALDQLQEKKACDVILLDLSLPDSQGLTTVSRMQTAAPRVPIVVLTGMDDDALGIEAVRIGAQDYLVKGQTDGRLLSRTIHYAAERQRAQEAIRRLNQELEQRVRERTRELAEKVRILEAFFATSMNPIVFLDKDFNFIRVNEAYAKSCARDVSEFPGQNHFDMYPSELRETFEQVVRVKLPWHTLARPFVFPDHPEWGVTYWDLGLIPILDERGEVEFLVFSLNDVTATKLAEQARARLQGQLHQAQKMEAVGQLAAGLGHDFGNLLATILACASQAKDFVKDSRLVLEALDGVEDAARQAKGIVQSLLTFSCQAVTRRQPVNLCEVLEESAYLLRHALPSSVRFTSRAYERSLWINADPVHVEQILLNLAINARDAMPDGGTLEITLSPGTQSDLDGLQQAAGPTAGFVRLTVRDTGMGIPPEIRHRIFEPFFTTKPRDRATGLGLSIIHGVVHDLGGRIDVDSEVAQGTTFTILLPCIEPPAGDLERVSVSPEIPELRGQVAALAGGSPHERGIMGATLRLMGFDVVQAEDQAGMEVCCDEHRERLRLIIVDHEAFGGQVFEYLSSLRASGIQIPVVVIYDESDVELADRAGPGFFPLRKPFGMPELSKMVCEVLGIC
jgi:two-component system, cell cycle sensor histidine kinase and response regulator CckA